MTPMSIRPSDAVAGGAVPVNTNLLWKECRFNLFTYPGTNVTTVAARINFVADDGSEYEQQYSVGDPAKYAVSEDGKTIDGPPMKKSSNLDILISNAVNAGFPENKIPENGDISAFDGLYAYHIGIPEPERAGLKREPAKEGETKYAKVISVPSQILRLPWEKKGAKPAAGKAAAAGAAPATDITAAALKFVAEQVTESDGKTTRQALAGAAFKKLAKDPNRDAIAGLIFKPEFQAALLGAGYTIDGENISKA